MNEAEREEKHRTLLARLQLALELEWATLPPYLVALLSIKRSSNRVAADLIRGVAMEEMLHLALVANVMNAVGGRPFVGKSNCPRYPLTMTFEGRPFADRTFPINLERFSKASMVTFMKIEQPQQPVTKTAWLHDVIDVPAPTIGEFYGEIVSLLEELDAALPGKLFSGDPSHQLESDFFWGGGGTIRIVTDLESAKAALRTVVDQGEGAWPWTQDRLAASVDHPLDMGHYYRFSEIFFERHFSKTDNPGKPPTGIAMPVDYTAVYPIKQNARTTDYPKGSRIAALNDAFNNRYTMMLRQLGEAINGTPNALYTAIMNGMHEMTSIARDLMEAPIADSTSGETACPTFEWID
ncbi:ferritin-like protein [Mesorhizobium sp. M0924]|uniref:ferritin-like domain-containing protein n=1 Tax=unclassified Mesorhizobium TaxID=325217 RepID=UPI000402AE99|nr:MULTISPECIES: ferritin-like protein [unclassified Mesorhizobium]WJI44558.1 ferritin-like protein [Mesorhizobium sp. C120A]WJI65334.1 ferritin-like protein [Mesorhizobium sp. C416B]